MLLRGDPNHGTNIDTLEDKDDLKRKDEIENNVFPFVEKWLIWLNWEVVEKWLKYLREELHTVAFKYSTQEQKSNLG
ncbi:hypothetical protein ACH5RR_037407 [Cinchona calisaya]|uniref:Uncharacterized protein n=1 Tax=Cinchona calisaya TaxID=153742 RepID=A0ABD2Y7C4_9GENT